jgi:hypothetical protein
MQLLKLKVDSLINIMNDDKLYALLEESLKNLKQLASLESVMVSEDEYTGDPDLGDLSDVQLDELEATKFIFKTNWLEKYNMGMSAPNSALFRRSRTASDYIALIAKKAEEASLLSIPLTTEQVQEFNKNTWKAISELSHLVYYFYLMNRTKAAQEETGELVISSVFKKYCDESNQNPLNVVNWVHSLTVSHRPKLKISEEFPDLVEELFEILGPYVSDFEEFEDLLTHDLLLTFVNDNMEGDHVISKLEEMKESKRISSMIEDDSDE